MCGSLFAYLTQEVIGGLIGFRSCSTRELGLVFTRFVRRSVHRDERLQFVVGVEKIGVVLAWLLLTRSHVVQ